MSEDEKKPEDKKPFGGFDRKGLFLDESNLFGSDDKLLWFSGYRWGKNTLYREYLMIPELKAKQEEPPETLPEISIKSSDIIDLSGAIGAEPDPNVIQFMRDEMMKAFSAAVESTLFSGRPNPAPNEPVDALRGLMAQYKSIMEKAEAKGIKKGWVFCVPPEFIPILQAKLKPFANEAAPVPIGGFGISQLAGIPIYAVHTESGQMEYMPYEVAMAKYGNQILPRENSSEGENSED